MRYLIILSIVLTANLCAAWEGYDYDSGSSIDIESRDGNTIEYYDDADGEYHTGEIQDWGYDSSTQTNDLTVYDYDAGETRTLDME